MQDARGRYIEFCKSKFPSNRNLSGLKVVVDCANGATYQIAPAVFEELGAEVVSIGAEPDGVNINLDCGATKPKFMAEKVLEHRADLGVALDGDGDRLIMVDHAGEIVDGDEILYILATHQYADIASTAGVVGTLMSNIGLEIALREQGVAFQRAKVGDRYVMQLLEQESWSLGGETSGHIICLDKANSGDGIVAALQVLTCIVTTGQSLYQLKKRHDKIPANHDQYPA